jgi:hypothetical protein
MADFTGITPFDGRRGVTSYTITAATPGKYAMKLDSMIARFQPESE